ncbi:MAG: hypothetical protein P9M03_02060, partial [Candidatus Theseobacter exili]|nr:hypothetical protein [Candidatus Theseobacter exili]
PAGLRVKDPAAFTDILEYLMVKRDAIQSDPFLQKSFWNRMDDAVDLLDPVTVILDFRLLEEQKGAGFHDLALWLRGKVNLVIVSEQSVDEVNEFLEKTAGLSRSSIEQIKVFAYGDKKTGVDEEIVEYLQNQAAHKGEAFDLSSLRFLGHKENRNKGVYGAFLSEKQIPSLFGDNLTSIAWAIGTILASENYKEIRDVLNEMGYSAQEIADLLPDEEGNIPPLTINRNYMEQLEKERETASAIEVMA